MTKFFNFLLLIFSLYTTIHALNKAKRDIPDLDGDDILKSLFTSDVKEKRKDRSVSLQEEQATNQKLNNNVQNTWNNYYNSIRSQATEKFDERREINPAQEFASNTPFISNPMPVIHPSESVSVQSELSQSSAVDPSLVAANYVPLPASPQALTGETKRSTIPSLDVANPVSVSSYPLKLHVHSPNAALQGIVPRFEEYGETVESVERAMKAQKRFNIPRPDQYDTEIVKKSSIPHPKESTHKTKKSKISKPKHNSSKRSKTKKSNVENKRQYIPQMQYMYNNPAYMNSIQSNGLAVQGQSGMMQFQTPQQQQIAPQVQNLDGAISRPVFSGEACSDLYAQCPDFAKNDYCINFKPQMETQCRKSCKFCVPKENTETPAPAAQRSDASDDLESGDGGSGSGDNSELKQVEQTGSKRHDILQERAKINSEIAASGDVDSGSGSGESGSGEEVVENNNDLKNPSEFHIPTKKNNVDNSDDNEESGSGSGSGSGDESNETSEPVEKEAKNVKLKQPSKKVTETKHEGNVKRMRIPKPAGFGSYPRIDLKAIASALAHYEEAALELAGEYPKPQDVDVTEYTRSFIPRPETVEQVQENRNRQNIQIAKIITSERARKSNIPKFLRVTNDAKKSEVPVTDADSLDQVQQRFLVPGVEPTLNDYYAETGKLNPFARKQKNYKKSHIETLKNTFDPYEYLRDMPAGASMEPIIDPSKRSDIKSDHSYPVFLMKVSPADEKKYVDEPAERRGKIRYVDAEGIQVTEERMRELQREKIAQYEANTLSSVPLSAVTQRSNAPVPKAPFNVAASRRSQLEIAQQKQNFLQQQQQQQQFNNPSFQQLQIQPKQQEQQMTNTANFQQMQSNRYAAAMAEQQLQQQEAAMNAASMFPNAQQIPFEQQPGESSLKGKMLSAFFDVKSNNGPDEGSGTGSGDGSSETPLGGDYTNLYNLLKNPEEQGYPITAEQNEKKDIVPDLTRKSYMSSTQQQTSTAASEKKDSIATTQDTNNYLRSNLAQLTPENTMYNSYQMQNPLVSNSFGAEFTVNQMPKTQETSWIRPNAQSELASAMPVLSNQAELAPTLPSLRATQNEETASWRSFIPQKNQPSEISLDFPKVITKSKIAKLYFPVNTEGAVNNKQTTLTLQPQHFKKDVPISSEEAAKQFQHESFEYYYPHSVPVKKSTITKNIHHQNKIITQQLTKSNIPNSQSEMKDMTKKPYFASEFLQNKGKDKSKSSIRNTLSETKMPKASIPYSPLIEMEKTSASIQQPKEVSNDIFPKSTVPSNYQQKGNTLLKAPTAVVNYSPVGVSNSIFPKSVARKVPKTAEFNNNDIPIDPIIRNFMSFANNQQTPQSSQIRSSWYLPFTEPTKTVNDVAKLNNNQQSTVFSADVGNAKYDLTKSSIPTVHVLKTNMTNNDQNIGSSFQTVGKKSDDHSLIGFLNQTKPKYDTTIVKKNLIKQKPDLGCGEDWKGAEGDFGTFCYKDTNMKATFDDAYAHCRRLKGNLFSVLNAYENRYLQENVHSDFWIGYRDKGSNGFWNWTDGSRSIYTNWGKNQDDSNPRHDCVYLDSDEGKWRDESCKKDMPFLCEMKSESCPQGPEKWDFLQMSDTKTLNGCYRFFNKSSSWEEAEQTCRSKGAHLASLNSESEQQMIYQHFSSKSFWIGFNDRENEGDWQWADRMTSSYTNWADDAPDNGGLSCASMVEGGKWHDDNCKKKLNIVCKKRGPKPEKSDGFNSQGVLLPVARLLNNEETAPSHLYDNLDQDGSAPVVPIFYWPLLKNSKLGMAGNHPLAVNGDVKAIAGGIQLDGQSSFLDAGDFHGKCIGDPDKCSKGFSVGLQVKFDDSVRYYKNPHYVIDTAGEGKGFTIFISAGKLHYRVVSSDGTWEKSTDITTSRWQDIVLTWNKAKGLQIYVNGAIKDSQSKSESTEITTTTSSQMLIGRKSGKQGDESTTKMVIASVAMFSKQLSIEDVPYAFTYGDTVVASYRWLMNDIQNSEVPGAPEIEKRKDLTDIDGGIFIDGSIGWLQLEDFPSIIHDVSKANHGFSISFKLKFDQRVREYKEPRYILDTGGHIGGVTGISVYLVNDNMYFQVIDTAGEDVMIWKVRTPIYTVRWQQIVMTWRLDKGLWVYLDGMFRGRTKTPETLPEEVSDSPKRFYIGRKNKGPEYQGSVFGFSSLAIYGRYLKRTETEKVFGNSDNPFQGIIREVWRNIGGESLADLKSEPDFPNNPSTIEIIQNFDAPFNLDRNYGSKLKGYFIAPETGNTTFFLSCSRSCELYFSKDEEGKKKERIIQLNQSTEHNVWNKYSNQISDEIFLIAGKYYYLEAAQKAVDSSDSLSVGVRLPTGRYQRPINKENLQWRLPGNPHAGLIRDVWYNIPGYTISDLTSDSNYPHRPSSTEVLDKFDAPFNVDDNYGAQISGYFHAPETGEYKFYIATDSWGELWLSKDDSETNLQKIITLNGWTEHNEWTKYSEQKSDKIFLVEDKYYYIRLYMKADKLGDCASAAVELPSGRFEGPIKKKHLSWKLIGLKEGPGPKEIIDPIPKPVGLFELNDESMKDMLTADENKIKFGDVSITTGPRDSKANALWFKGNSSSYIEIPNNGSLDTRRSITILANIYPTGDNGPIVNYNPNGWGVHLWQFEKTELFVRFVTRSGAMTTQPLGTRVLQLNTWNQVGASYDRNTGVAQLWHDGKMVKSRNIGQVELSTNLPIRLGARVGDKRYYQGKISCVQIYDKALTEEEIGELRNCPRSRKGGDSSDDDTNADMKSTIQKVSEVGDSHVGDDTEEELIVLEEKSRATRCDPNPCRNNGVCQDDDKKIDGFMCSCPGNFTGIRCQVSRLHAENPIVKRTNIPQQPTNNTIPFSPNDQQNTSLDFLARTLMNGGNENVTANRTVPTNIALINQSTVNSTATFQPINTSTDQPITVANSTTQTLQGQPVITNLTSQDQQLITNSTLTEQPITTNSTATNQPIISNGTVNGAYFTGTTIANNGTLENSTIPNDKSAAKPDESKEDISLLYQKLGCYKDDLTNHDLKTQIDLKRTTQEECAKACAMKDKNFSYFGLQNGTSCYCGKDHGKYGKLPDTQCNITCNGNEAENCGGYQANNVFFYGLGTSYTIKTFTGKELGAGTDAKIYFELIGDRGSSDFRQLDSTAEKYEPGSVDAQTFLLPDLGKLKRMKILHDNTGTAPSWYLDKVQVTDEEGGKYEFNCDDWLSDTKGGGKLERELTAKSVIPRVT